MKELTPTEQSHYLQIAHPDLPGITRHNFTGYHVERKVYDNFEMKPQSEWGSEMNCHTTATEHKSDYDELMDSPMYKQDEVTDKHRIWALEKIVVVLTEENKRLKDALWGHHHSLPNDTNNY